MDMDERDEYLRLMENVFRCAEQAGIEFHRAMKFIQLMAMAQDVHKANAPPESTTKQ